MRYGLIGRRLSHSYSREIHEKILGCAYELIELEPCELEKFMRDRPFSGINVTMPYKRDVIKYLDGISPVAERIGAVNTIVSRTGKLYGYNTDYVGMKELVRHAKIDIAGKVVLILGGGGASRSVHEAMRDLGAKEIIHVSRGEYEYPERLRLDAQVMVNATPVGMYPDVEGMLVDTALFPELTGLLDLIYNPIRTNLVLSALTKGINACGGLYMLCAQAVYANALFTDRKVCENLIEKSYERLLSDKQNIVLTGMPSSGKTTLGRNMAALMKRPFYDTDEMIRGVTGISASDFIRTCGEDKFREVERGVIDKVSGKNGCIIATGGGAVLDDNNIRALKRNGVLLYLRRSLDELSGALYRPLSSDPQKLAAMYEKRLPLYEKAADIVV